MDNNCDGNLIANRSCSFTYELKIHEITDISNKSQLVKIFRYEIK